MQRVDESGVDAGADRNSPWDKLKFPSGLALGLAAGLFSSRLLEERGDSTAAPVISAPSGNTDRKVASSPAVALTPLDDVSRREPVPIPGTDPPGSEPVNLLALPCTDPDFRAGLAVLHDRYFSALRKAITECGFTWEVVPPDLRERIVHDAADSLYGAYHNGTASVGDVGGDSVYAIRSQLQQLIIQEIRSRGIKPISPGTDPNVPEEYIFGAARGECKPLRVTTLEGEQLYLADETGVYKAPPEINKAILALWNAENALYNLDFKGAFAPPSSGK